jgi:hypothetical protein
METQQAGARSRRRVVAKAPEAPGKIKTAVHLSPEAFRRLGIAGVMEGKSQGQIVEELILAGLRHYVVSVRGDRPGAGGDVGSIGQEAAA